MTSMEDREKTLENKYAHDQHKLFRIEARASKLIGLWAAEKLSLTGEEAENYARNVVAHSLDEPGFGDVRKRVMNDLSAKSVDMTDYTLDAVIEKKMKLAADQIENDTK